MQLTIGVTINNDLQRKTIAYHLFQVYAFVFKLNDMSLEKTGFQCAGI
jgi:hypothetical protein